METENQTLMYRVMWDWLDNPTNWSDVILMTPKEAMDIMVRLEAAEDAGEIANPEVYETDKLGTYEDVLDCLPEPEEAVEVSIK